MRKEKTILISTHDMEEADVLGDRIAVMHQGSLKSFGSTMFLKKSIGSFLKILLIFYYAKNLNKNYRIII